MFDLSSFLIYTIVTAFTPGPNNITCMTNGVRKGFKKSLPFNAGLFTGQTIIVTLAALFCSALSRWVPRIKLPMLIVGAMYMLYLAWHLIKDTGEISESEHDRGTGYLSGIAFQLVNPKYILYCIVSLEVYVLPYFAGNPGMIALLSAVLVILAVMSNITWLAFGSAFKVIFKKYSRVINIISALLLVYCAITLFL